MKQDRFTTVVNSIYEKIVELSDLDLQRKLWLNQGNDSELISSYVELMCGLFDDYGFAEFVDRCSSKLGFNKLLRAELITLREMLNSYNGEGKSDDQIVNDPTWHEIVEQARKTRALWESMSM